jgi:G6PDH family F420-dependent oxidoreductase
MASPRLRAADHPQLGYALSSEEHRPNDLVRFAALAEDSGFEFALISDHYHPWTDRQGQSPFVFSVLGAIAQATKRLQIGTGVTCPTIRYHPALVAQMAATVADMMPGRFFLGLGSGENLNEHITGARWPEAPVRLEMLAEAIDVLRLLWQGGLQSHHGPYFTVENARIYTLPDPLPPLYVAAAGDTAARLAGQAGDGLIATGPDQDTLRAFDRAGGRGKPRLGQVTVCWAKDERSARRTAKDYWATSAIKGAASQELPLPEHFEALAEMVAEDDVAKEIACGPDPERHLAAIAPYLEAGFTHVYLHQVGPDQDGFFKFAERELLPRFARRAASGGRTAPAQDRASAAAGSRPRGHGR